MRQIFRTADLTGEHVGPNERDAGDPASPGG